MDLGYRTAVRRLHELNYHLRVPCPVRSGRMNWNGKLSSNACACRLLISQRNCGLVMKATSKAISVCAAAGYSWANGAPFLTRAIISARTSWSQGARNAVNFSA